MMLHPNKVRRLRLAKGLTTHQLAKKAGVSQGHISFIERGESSPTIHKAIRLAKVLGSPVEELFS